MNEHDRLAATFEENRAHLRAVAYRMLGSPSEANDAVQEAWLRFSGADTSNVENLGGWLTTIVARVCLDMLRARKSRSEESLGPHVPEPVVGRADGSDPEHEALVADAIGPALLVVLETLAPAERVAFVLHDVFAVPFDEIAPIVGRSPTAARQLASRARRRVQGVARVQNPGTRAGPDEDPWETPPSPRREWAMDSDVDRTHQRKVVEAFLAAAHDGDFSGLVALLDPEVVLRPDEAAVRMGASGELRGATAVARQFAGRARAAQVALVNGAAGLVWAPGGRPRVVFGFTITDGKIVTIDQLADPERIGQIDLQY